MQFELLLDLYMVSYLGLIVLELLFVFLRRQVKRVECRGEFRCGPIVHVKASMIPVSVRVWFFLLLKPQLHEVLKFGLDVCENGQAAKVAQAASLVIQFLWFNHINLRNPCKAKHRQTGSSQYQKIGRARNF